MLHTPIAVVGVSALFPGSTDAQGFWRDILAGRDLTSEIPRTHWLIEDYYDPDPTAPDKTYCKRGAFLPSVEFEPMEFGVPPSIMPATDTAQLLALIVAQKVLQDVGDSFRAVDRERVSVILGVTSGQELLGSMVSRLQRPVWLKALRESGLPESEAQAICERIANHYVPWQEATFPGLLGNVVAGRIANRFDLHGTNCVTDAACASALSALSMAVNELAVGQSDLVVTGGVDTMNDILMYTCFSKTPALSPTGDCRPFSSDADGTLLGEGIAMLALRRLADAERDDNRIYAVIQGVGSSSDGRSKSVYAPLSEGQARALRRAYAQAGYGPETVELVEAHGTATKAGDVAEFDGLKQVFGQTERSAQPWCALGSVKSQIGHTKAAAGVAGLIKAVLALHHKVLPPTIKVEQPNPKLELAQSPFYLNTEARPWIRDASHPRRASVSSFGFGGSNFHVALEEYCGPGTPALRLRTHESELFLFGADSARALAQRSRNQLQELEQRGFVSAAQASQEAFRSGDAARLAIVAGGPEDLAHKLDQALERLESAPEAAFSTPTGVHYEYGAESGDVAFLFPGQGSQYLGMGADLAIAFDEARAVWDAAAALRFEGLPLHEVVFPRPVFDAGEREALARRLTTTEWAQPAIGAMSLSVLAMLRACGLEHRCAGGHSFGELTALCSAGVFEAPTLLQVARKRGELMRDAAGQEGAMLAIPLAMDAVTPLLKAGARGLVIANHNHPTQVVVSGPREAIDRLARDLEVQKVSAKRLQVATAFHSPLVAGASESFREFLRALPLGEQRIDTYANAEAAVYPREPDAVRNRLSEQLARPVRFVEQVEAMWLSGVRTFVEVGPGAVLTDFVGRILSGRPHRAIATDRSNKNGVTCLLEALGRIAVAGVQLDFAPLWSRYRVEVERKRKPAMAIAINGANYGKRYPGAAQEEPKAPASAANTHRRSVSASSAAVQHGSNGMTQRPAPTERNVSTTAATSSAAPVLKPALSEREGLPGAAPPLPKPLIEGEDVRGGAVAPPSNPLPGREGVRGGAVRGNLTGTQAHTGASSDWLRAYQETQRAITEAQSSYQRMMAESHLSFLRTIEASFSTLSAALGDGMTWVEPFAVPSKDLPTTERETATLAPPVVVAHAEPASGSNVESEAPRAQAVPEPQPQVASAASPARPDRADLEALLLAVVAEKTGYPPEMLGLHMELEGDLGVDSIKRVEILATMRERAPGLPEIVASEMAALRTLGEIVQYMRDRLGEGESTGVQAESATPSRTAPESAVDLEPLLLAVVAEKTGYPAEMLGLHMELEGDLGIDSIKRVEILSLMRERAPGLPEVVASEMAALRTLGEIVQYMRDHAASSAPAAAAPAPRKSADLNNGVQPNQTQRWVVRAVPSQAPGLALPGLARARHVVLTEDGGGVAHALARLLRERGLHAEVVEQIPREADAVLFLGGLREVRAEDEALAINEDAFRVAKAASARLAEQGGVFVTVQDTGGDFGLSGTDPTRAWLAGIAALARTAALEWANAAVKCIDLKRAGRSAEDLAGVLAEELFAGGSVADVGLSPGARCVLQNVPKEVSAGPLPVNEQSVVVVSGGARGVTSAALLRLMEQARPRVVVLLGRTQLSEEPVACRGLQEDAALKRALLQAAKQQGESLTPAELSARAARVRANREVRATLDAIAQRGGQARYIAVDVQDGPSVARVLDAVRAEWGPITGLVHAAGVLADKRIAEKTPEQFARVFGTKVRGLRALLQATAQDPLTFLVMFSSVAARTGNPGQSDYAMANEILNAVAVAEQRRRQGTCLVKSLGWGPWESGMVTPELKSVFEQRHVPLLSLADGAARFTAELAGPPDEVVSVIGGELGHDVLGAKVTGGEIGVDKRSHPFLSDHRVGGKVVVPVVVALDWLVRGACDYRPGLRCVEVRDLKVLRGIKLEEFDTEHETFSISLRPARELGDAWCEAELRGQGSALHYSARLWLMPVDYRLESQELAVPEVQPFGGQPVYDGHVLFHGPQFQGIRGVDGVSRAGAIGTLIGARELGWRTSDFALDPGLLDAALQLGTLWACKVLGGATLPMAIGAYRLHRPGLSEGPVRCIVRAHEVHSARAVADIQLLDAEARTVGELFGVENVLRPGETVSEGLSHAL